MSSNEKSTEKMSNLLCELDKLIQSFSAFQSECNAVQLQSPAHKQRTKLKKLEKGNARLRSSDRHSIFTSCQPLFPFEMVLTFGRGRKNTRALNSSTAVIAFTSGCLEQNEL